MRKLKGENNWKADGLGINVITIPFRTMISTSRRKYVQSASISGDHSVVLTTAGALARDP